MTLTCTRVESAGTWVEMSGQTRSCADTHTLYSSLLCDLGNTQSSACHVGHMNKFFFDSVGIAARVKKENRDFLPYVSHSVSSPGFM